MAGKGGGAWKVAYADFVTAMMAFFLVMWITSQSQPVREAVAGYFEDPYGHPNKRGGSTILPIRGGSPARAPRRPMGARQRGRSGGSGTKWISTTDPEANSARKPTLFVVHDGDRESSGVVVFFAQDATELDQAAQERLSDLVTVLLGKANKIEIRAHAVPARVREGSPDRDLWQLCYARCLATMKFLEAQGIEPQRIRLVQAAAYEPFTLREEEQAQSRNSRVEVFMLREVVADLSGTRQERDHRFGTPP